jgi:hypothetical protein
LARGAEQIKVFSDYGVRSLQPVAALARDKNFATLLYDRIHAVS